VSLDQCPSRVPVPMSGLPTIVVREREHVHTAAGGSRVDHDAVALLARRRARWRRRAHVDRNARLCAHTALGGTTWRESSRGETERDQKKQRPRESESERERERQRDRETERPRDRATHRTTAAAEQPQHKDDKQQSSSQAEPRPPLTICTAMSVVALFTAMTMTYSSSAFYRPNPEHPLPQALAATSDAAAMRPSTARRTGQSRQQSRLGATWTRADQPARHHRRHRHVPHTRVHCIHTHTHTRTRACACACACVCLLVRYGSERSPVS
jgi:hypothetical protein